MTNTRPITDDEITALAEDIYSAQQNMLRHYSAYSGQTEKEKLAEAMKRKLRGLHVSCD